MEMETAKQPVLNVYPPMRWVQYADGVMILQVLTVVSQGKSAWLNVPTVNASSVYLEKSESVQESKSESVSVVVEEKPKKKDFWNRKK